MRTYIKNIFIITLIAVVSSCTKQPYYEIPRDENGNVVITDVAKTTSAGVTTLDGSFTVTSYLPNAKAGDVMKIELLNLQTPPGGGNAQLLPMQGTQKEVTLGNDLKATVEYTRNEAKLVNPGDFVTITFAGKTDAATYRVTLKTATSVSNPQIDGQDVDVIRDAGTAYFKVSVEPASGAYTGDVLVKRKNGENEPWQMVGTFSAGDEIPVSGNDFALGKDTMFYSFATSQSGFNEEVVKAVIASDPYFLVKKAGKLSSGSSANGFNLINGSAVAATDANAVITLGTDLKISQGSAWATGGKGISFVSSSLAAYNSNSVNDAKTAFVGGTPVTTIDPSEGDGVFVFKLVNGPNPEDVIYGMIKATELKPGVSVDFEYRIGNIYAHLEIVK